MSLPLKPSFRSTLLQSELTVLAHHNSIVSNHNISHIRFLLFGSLSFSFWLLSAFFGCFICIYHAHVTFSFFFTWFISRKWPYIWTTKYTFTSFYFFLFRNVCSWSCFSWEPTEVRVYYCVVPPFHFYFSVCVFTKFSPTPNSTRGSSEVSPPPQEPTS